MTFLTDNRIGHLLCQAGTALRTRWAFRRLGARHRDAVRQLHALADYLEEIVFPHLKSTNSRQVTLRVSVTETGHARLWLQGRSASQRLTGTDEFASLLVDSGIRSIGLATRLESNQVVQCLLLAVYCREHLASATPEYTDRPGLHAQRLAQAMLHPAGLHRFCARLRFDRSRSHLSVAYAYCELFGSRVINRWIERIGKAPDHRALFATAPLAGVLAAVLVLLVILVHPLHPTAGLVAGLVVTGVLGLGTWLLVHTLGSLQYDREHRDALLQDRLHQITRLSQFPVVNPNPVLKLDDNGHALYCNPAAYELIEKLGLDRRRPEDLFDRQMPERVRACLDQGVCPDAIEQTLGGRTLWYLMRPIPDERAVIVSGQDITQIKQLEDQLRRANESLEERVRARTFELLLTQDVTIMSLSTLAETRDAETGAHLERTRRYVRVLAEALRKHPRFRDELDDDQAIELLYRSAPLHDIGKVGIPDAVLQKPGPLSAEEWEIMRRHTILGGDALEWAEKRLGSNSFLRWAREIAYYHHEWTNGTGYPFGLRGDDIPVAARLMALADVYDALTTRRYYKDAYSHDTAVQMICEASGTHFDPDVVEAFRQNLDHFSRIATELDDRKTDAPELLRPHDLSSPN